MERIKNKSTITFLTDSFVLSSYLLAKGHKPISINWENPRRATFAFKDSNEIKTLVDKFWRWEGSIEPREFAGKQKELKNMLFSERH